MEMILISSKKLKVMLSQSDLEKRQLCADIDCSSKKTRKVIRSILEEIREKTGFDTTGESTYIQFFVSRDGGCEIFITKEKENTPDASSNSPDKENEASETNKSTEESDASPIETTERIYSQSKAKNCFPVPTYSLFEEEAHKKIAFSFEKLSYLLSVCRRLKNTYSSHSSAYCDDNGNYFLLLDSNLLSKYTRLDNLTFILEYGERQNPDSLLAYIDEHGKTICEKNAVQILADM